MSLRPGQETAGAERLRGGCIPCPVCVTTVTPPFDASLLTINLTGWRMLLLHPTPLLLIVCKPPHRAAAFLSDLQKLRAFDMHDGHNDR